MNLSIKEKVYGTLFGYAIGDALGIGTEFMSSHEVAMRYPDGLRNYFQIVRDGHRSFWEKGEFSSDTESIAILLESIGEKDRIDLTDIAERMKKWYDSDPIDLTVNNHGIIPQPDFTKFPLESTKRAWRNISGLDSTSECLGRAFFTGFWNEDTERNVLNVCRMTHPHERCEGSSLVIATMSNSLFWKEEEAPYDYLMQIARRYHPDIVKHLEMARHGDLSDFNIDDEESYWHVTKVMGIALWALWHCESPYEGLFTIVNQGGDADTNASLATALLVLKHGIEKQREDGPSGLLDKDRLYRIANKVTDVLTNKFGHSART